MLGTAAIDAVWAVRDELLLFGMAGFVLGGLDDLAIDILWFARLAQTRRSATAPLQSDASRTTRSPFLFRHGRKTAS